MLLPFQADIWFYQQPIDFRKQIDGLAILVASHLKKDSAAGQLFLFRNRQADKIKLLLIPKVLATAAFLSNIIVSKVDDRQPLYHLEKQFEKRYQFYLSRQRLAHYYIEAAKALQPLCNLMQDVIISYDVSSCDATGLQVLQEPGRPATRKSYVYRMRGGSPDQSVVLYDYNALDHKQYIMNWYAGFAGFLHVDADPFFDRFLKSDTVQLSYCNAHARRRFEKITQQTKNDGLTI